MARVSDRELAVCILKELAQYEYSAKFAPMGFYDDDADSFQAIADATGVSLSSNGATVKFRRKLMRVCNRLCDFGVLGGQVKYLDKQYSDEPRRQKDFGFLRESTYKRLNPAKYPFHATFSSIDEEIDFQLRHAYPKPPATKAARAAGE